MLSDNILYILIFLIAHNLICILLTIIAPIFDMSISFSKVKSRKSLEILQLHRNPDYEMFLLFHYLSFQSTIIIHASMLT